MSSTLLAEQVLQTTVHMCKLQLFITLDATAPIKTPDLQEERSRKKMACSKMAINNAQQQQYKRPSLGSSPGIWARKTTLATDCTPFLRPLYTYSPVPTKHTHFNSSPQLLE